MNSSDILPQNYSLFKNDSEISDCPGMTDLFGAIWNKTSPGTLARVNCPDHNNFNQSEYATRQCLANGTWYTNSHGIPWADYSRCLIQDSKHKVIYVYYAGYIISAICLLVSLIIFFFFKQLRCDRITLHKNLFMCHLFNAMIWLAFYLDISYADVLTNNMWHCQLLFLIATYFSVGTYFWMFSEGMYLVVVLIITFNHGSVLIWVCIVSGWSMPLILTIIYSFIRYFKDEPTLCWTEKDNYNRILIIPIIVALSANLVMSLFIMKTLFTKLRHPSNREEAQWSKTAKAVFILIPLLGLQNIILIASPTNGEIAYEYISAILSSFQGTVVSLALCFFNQEVKGIFRQRTYQSTSLQPRKFSRRSTFVSETNSSNQPRRSVIASNNNNNNINDNNSIRPSIVSV